MSQQPRAVADYARETYATSVAPWLVHFCIIGLLCLSFGCWPTAVSAATIHLMHREVEAETRRLEREHAHFTFSADGLFKEEVAAGGRDKFSKATQSSWIRSSGTILRIGGEGAAYSEKSGVGASEITFAKSRLILEFSVDRTAAVALQGQLSIPRSIVRPDDGDFYFDNSAGSILLRSAGQRLFESESDGPFSFNQSLEPGDYRLAIETVAALSTLRNHRKSVDWELTMRVQEVPEPAATTLLGIGIGGGLYWRSNRRSSQIG